MSRNSRGMAPVMRWIIVCLFALFPIASHALALGKLKVHSALNEPLNAEIDFTFATEKELKGLNVSLASRADFDAAGVDRLPFLARIKFIVTKKPDGGFFLQLSTEEPVDEPFLHLLIQVDWPGGRLVREYTALIDPPYLIAGKAAPVEVPKVTAPAPTPEVQPPQPAVAQAPPAEAPPAEAPPAEAPPAEVPPTVAKTEEPKAPEAAKAEEVPPKEEPAKEAASAEINPEEQKLGPPEILETPEAAQGVAPEEPVAPKVEPLEATPKAEAAPAQEQQAPAEPASQTTPVWTTVSEYNVKNGDTLWRIAEKMRAGNNDVSVEQVMLAIYRTNKNAFFGNNANNLKAGKILKTPERQEVDAVTVPQARREFRAQYDAWQEYKLKLASASNAVKVTETPEPAAKEQPAAAERAAKPVMPETAKPEQPKSATRSTAKNKQDELLKIVRNTLQRQKSTPDKKVAEKESTGEEANREQQALADRAATLEESLESKRLENKDLSEKVGIVRSQLKKESRLIELESQSLAQQQKQAPETKPAEPVVKPAEKPAAKEPGGIAKVEPLPPVSKSAPTVTAPTAPKKKITPPPAPKKEEPGFLASLLEALQSDLLMPVVIGIVVLMGGGVALVYFRQRQKSIAEFEESILSADAISTDQPATTGTPDSQKPAVTAGGDTSFLSDFSQGGMGNIHTDEVDPVAEAEVYLAYGRDETAEEILKEAMVKNPDRHELKLKLLEIYHQRNDVSAFETLAEELYAALGGRGGKIWEKVEEMGRKLNPENPMFRGGAPAKGPSAASAAKAAPVAAPTRAESHVDFHAADVTTAKTETAGDFDFDIGALDAGGKKPAAPPEAHAKSGAEAGLESLDFGAPADNAIDFDIDGKSDAAAKQNAPAPGGDEIKWEPEPAAAPAADVDLVAAFPAGNGQGSAQWDETATKLDLAKAYIDMGDAEGARSILQEVMAEGSEPQKKQAQELSAQIA